MEKEKLPALEDLACSNGLKSSTVSEDDRLRSQYMQRIICDGNSQTQMVDDSIIPRVLVQFWDNLRTIPPDVGECMYSWQSLDKHGFKRLLFDDKSAEKFISEHFERRYLDAFKHCRHPAMRSDYFRLCFIVINGGFYVDADDVYKGGDLEWCFKDNRLKLQPLCYNSSSDSMVDTADFMIKHRNSSELVFYVNNNPIIAPANHPVVRMALERSTQALLTQAEGAPQNVQSTTGPGNLTASLVRHAIEVERNGKARDFLLFTSWRTISVSQWPLEYRNDKRNWRLWDGHGELNA